MKRKTLSSLEEQLLHSIKGNEFLLCFYYFINSKSEHLIFEKWYNNFNFFPFNQINSIFIDYEKDSGYKNRDEYYGFWGFINKSTKEGKIEKDLFDKYYNLIATIDNKKYKNLSILLNNILIHLSLFFDNSLLKEYGYLNNFEELNKAKKYDLRSTIFFHIKNSKNLNNTLNQLHNEYNSSLLQYINKNYKENLSRHDYQKLFENQKEIIPLNKKLQKISQQINDNNNKLEHLKNLINGDTQLDISLFKNNLTSNIKGVIGESVFSDMIGGEVIGFLGNKTDVIKKDKNFSVKTTYGNSWNNHLAYISDKEITNIFLERKRFSDIEKNINDFKRFCFSLFSGNEEIDVLTLQKIKIQDLNNSIMESTQYLIPMSLINKLITEKSYFFNNSELILVYEREQVLKLSIKERSNNLQAMLITNCENMEYLIEKNLIEKMTKNNVKIKPNLIS